MPRVISGSSSHYTLSQMALLNPDPKQQQHHPSRLTATPPRSTSTTNLSIAVPDRRPPLKSASTRVTRSTHILPLDYDSRERSTGSVSSTGGLKRNLFRAVETGKSDILPTTASGRNTTPNRRRAKSSASNFELKWMSNSLMTSSNSSGSNNSHASETMRSRRKHQASTLPMFDSSPGGAAGGCSGHQGRQDGGGGGGSMNGRVNTRSSSAWGDSKSKAHQTLLLQLFVLVAVTCLVCDSYFKAIKTSQRMDKFDAEENMLMLHLQRLERQALQLHENIGRLVDRRENEEATAGDARPSSSSSSSSSSSATDTDKNDATMDSDLIRVQAQQLQQMEEEVGVELRSLQAKLQHTAREGILHTFGQGPIQVDIDLNLPRLAEFEGAAGHGSNRVSILLSYDTPYAAWALLRQINEGIWTGAKFKFGKGFSVVAEPENTPESLASETHLEFVEKTSKTHEAMTVGLVNSDKGGLAMFINLQDNNAYHKFDACVGKVVDGFDALQRLVTAARKGKRANEVSIKSASASHLSRNQAAGLI